MKSAKRLATFLFLAGNILGAAQTWAAQFDVTLSSDPGNTWTANTLRWAAASANASPGFDLINIIIQGAQGNTININADITFTDAVNLQGHAGQKTTL
jgi:hypothetical protein